ncbi:aminotransferase class IV family protein [Rhodobacteraceae bacterium KMM 6894]|nr:aminotransferase class IV family protein [Rhodobacteraceae bacterium KMM 6894]
MESPLCPSVDPDFALIETLGWTPDAGFAHRARHLRRLTRSARHFGIMPRGVPEALDSVTAPHPLRVRLTLDATGAADITTTAFTRLPPDTVWRVAIHPTRLTASDPWLRHKTTRRALYDSARADLPPDIDEWIFLNTGGALCEGTITNLYIPQGDTLLTPPRACGLLPGIGREALIAAGRAKPQRLGPDDITGPFYVGNALRGLIQARLVSFSW